MVKKLISPAEPASDKIPGYQFTAGGIASLIGVSLVLFSVFFWCAQHTIEKAMLNQRVSHPTSNSLLVTMAICIVAEAYFLLVGRIPPIEWTRGTPESRIAHNILFGFIWPAALCALATIFVMIFV